MSNVSASTPPITVADLDAAKQVATDCIEAAVIVREALHATDYPLPRVLKEQPPPEVHETIAMLLEGLNRAITGEPLIAKVEPYFTALGAAELPGVGIEANWHRLALRFAMLARGGIVNGIREAATEQMMQSAGELLAARERIWESKPKTLDIKIAKLPVPKELKARAKADAERCERLIIREPGQPPRPAQTADEIAAVGVPRTWRVIRKKIGDLMEIDLGVLSARLDSERLCAVRLAAAMPPPPRIVFHTESNSVTVDGKTYPDLDPYAFEVAKVLHAQTCGDGERSIGPEKLRALLTKCGDNKTLSRRIDALPDGLRDCVRGLPGRGRWFQPPTL